MTDLITWLNANQGFALTVLTFIYVLATIAIIAVQVRSNRLAAKNIQTIVNLERERTRPTVLFSLNPRDHAFVFAEARNVGETTAFDITIDINPVPHRDVDISPARHRDVDSRKNIRFIKEGIASLPPGADVSTLIGAWNHVKSENESLLFSGTVSYRSKEGTTYSEPFVVDLSAHEDLIHFTKKTTHDVANTLEKIQRDLHAVASGRKKIVVRTISEDDYQEQRRQQLERSRELVEQHKREQTDANEKGST